MAKRKKGRPGAANHKDKQVEAKVAQNNHIHHIKRERESERETDTDTPNIEQNTVQGKYRVLPILCCSLILGLPIYLELSALASILGLDVQSMFALQWHAALLVEQWASRVSPKLASPHLPMAFFIFQDAAFLCALAWSVFIVPLSYG